MAELANRPSGSEQLSQAGSRKPTAASMYSKFRNRVMFPIANEAGKVIAFTGRTLAPTKRPARSI